MSTTDPNLNCYSLLLGGKCTISMCKGSDSVRGLIGCFFGSILISSSVYCTTLSLRNLSGLCRRYCQFIVALRFLNAAYRLCTMYEFTITPSFVENEYPKKRRKIKKKLMKME